MSLAEQAPELADELTARGDQLLAELNQLAGDDQIDARLREIFMDAAAAFSLLGTASLADGDIGASATAADGAARVLEAVQAIDQDRTRDGPTLLEELELGQDLALEADIARRSDDEYKGGSG